MTIKEAQHHNWLFQYWEKGRGVPLIMIHGYPGRVQDFRWLDDHLEGIRRIALSMPGFDGTRRLTPGAMPTTIADRARVIIEFMDAIGLDKAFLLGHSMGGPLAVAACTDVPQRIKGLILLSSVGPMPYKAFRRSQPRIGHLLMSGRLGGIFRPLMRYMFHRMGFPKGVSDESMAYVLHCAHEFSFEEHSRNITAMECKTASIWAEDDPLIEADCYHALDAALPDGPRLSYVDGGHNPQRLHPEKTARLIVEFMERS